MRFSNYDCLQKHRNSIEVDLNYIRFMAFFPRSLYRSTVGRFRSAPYFHANVNAELVLAFLLHLSLLALAILIVYINGFIKGKGEPYNTIMPAPITRFGDFFGVFDIWKTNAGFGGVGYGASYFPGLYIFVEFFHLVTKDIWVALKILCVLYLSFISGSILIFLRSRGLATTVLALTMVLISYPSLFAIHTGNLEMLIFILILLASFAAYSNKWAIFAVLIGLATSAKFFPGIFAFAPFVLISPKIAFRTFLLTIRVSIMFTIAALFFLPGGIYSNGVGSFGSLINSILESQSMYSDLMVTGVPGLHFGHSLLNGLHAVFGMNFLPSETWSYPIMFIGLGWTSAAWFLVRKLHPPIWLVFGFLGCTGCIFVPTSTDYKLLYLLPALILYVRDHNPNNRTFFHVSLLVIAIAPKPYFYVGTNPWTNANVWLTPILLLLFQVYAVMLLRQKVTKS